MPKHFVLLVGLAACSSSGNPTGIAPETCPTDSTLTYTSFGESFVATNCLSCHDRQQPVLTSQAAIQANSANILDVAVYTDAMPQSSNMSIDERQLLGEWLACGAP
jgi:hypothetical protein